MEPEDSHELHPREARITIDDWVMVALAAASVSILLVESGLAWTLEESTLRVLVMVDLAIVLSFILEFALRLLRSPGKRRFIISNWYDVIGMIPISHVLLRSFRLLRLVRILVMKSRLVRDTEKGTFGEMTAEAVVRRYRLIVVRAIGHPLLLQSLDVLEGPLGRSRLPATVGETLSKRREDLRELVKQSLRRVPMARRLMHLPKSEEVLSTMEDVSLEVIVGILASEQINETVQASILAGLDELRRSVRAEEEDPSTGASEGYE